MGKIERDSRLYIGEQVSHPITSDAHTPHHNVYSEQFGIIMREQVERFKFQYGVEGWKLEQGQTFDKGECTMYVNLWIKGELVLPMAMSFKGMGDDEVLTDRWRKMYHEFVRYVNEGRVFSRLAQGLVAVNSQRKEDSTSEEDSRGLEGSRSKRLR